jgi:hypothetical protein
MRRTAYGAIALVLAVNTASALECPREDEVKAGLQKFVTEVWWTAESMATWHVVSFSDFSFGPMRFGKVVRVLANLSGQSVDACPVKVEYTYTLHQEDGSTRVDKMGAGKTHYFYQDEFGDWALQMS